MLYLHDVQFRTKYLMLSFHTVLHQDSGYIKGGCLINAGTFKITKKDKHRNATGWLQPLNRGFRGIQVTNTVFV